MAIRILLADDHTLMRSGLRSLLEMNTQYEVIAEAADGREAMQLVDEFKPDLVIMDISMPNLNGMEATQKILENHPGIKVIALSVHSEKPFVVGMLKAGASGYLLKDCAVDELGRAIDTVIHNQTYLSPKISNTVVQGFRELVTRDDQSVFGLLTDREREVLQLIAEGKSTKQIAGDLYVSVKTVETHRQNIMNKLEIYNIPELVKYAIREGLVSL